jgi:hypothetical protein
MQHVTKHWHDELINGDILNHEYYIWSYLDSYVRVSLS